MIVRVDTELLNACLKKKKISNSAASLMAGLSKPYTGGVITQGATQDFKFAQLISAVFNEQEIEPWILNDKQACRFNEYVICEDTAFVKCVHCGWCPAVMKERKEKANEIFANVRLRNEESDNESDSGGNDCSGA